MVFAYFRDRRQKKTTLIFSDVRVAPAQEIGQWLQFTCTVVRQGPQAALLNDAYLVHGGRTLSYRGNTNCFVRGEEKKASGMDLPGEAAVAVNVYAKWGKLPLGVPLELHVISTAQRRPHVQPVRPLERGDEPPEWKPIQRQVRGRSSYMDRSGE